MDLSPFCYIVVSCGMYELKGMIAIGAMPMNSGRNRVTRHHFHRRVTMSRPLHASRVSPLADQAFNYMSDMSETNGSKVLKRGSDAFPYFGKAADSSVTDLLNTSAGSNIQSVIAELEK